MQGILHEFLNVSQLWRNAMLERVFKSEWIVQQLRSGPFADHIDDFVEGLTEQGYGLKNLPSRLGPISDFNRWLIAKRYSLEDLDESRIEEFIRYRVKRRPGSVRAGNIFTVNLLIAHLRDRRCLPPACPLPSENGEIQELILSYVQYLRGERGLCDSSIERFSNIARDFLLEVFETGEVCLERVTRRDILGFITRCGERFSSRGTQLVATALRSLLRFLVTTGAIASELAECIPSVRGWRAAHLPEFLTDKEVKQLLRTCDRRTAKGLRNYAMLLIMLRLGLRASEVLHLKLDDIDWRGGIIAVQGKRGRVETLPLPHDVGEALVAYIRRARPQCSSRNLFIRIRAPRRELNDSRSIGTIVRRALVAAGINSQSKGAHLLRYTAATRTLRQGAALFEVGDLLRHRSVDTTALYAKVDVTRLSEIATPWPTA